MTIEDKPKEPAIIEVLRDSARDWIESQGKSLSDYTAHGIHLGPDSYIGGLGKLRSEASRRGCEVVVNFRPFGENTSWCIIYGTGLAPKKRDGPINI